MINQTFIRRFLFSFITIILSLISFQSARAAVAPEENHYETKETMTGRYSDVMKDEVNMDPKFYSYYKKCKNMVRDPRVLTMLDTLYQRAEKAGDKRTMAAALTQKAMHFYYTRGNQDSLRKYTRDVQKFSYENELPVYYYWIWMKYAENYVNKRQYSLATVELDAMEKEAREENCIEGIIDSYLVMARIYYLKKNYDMAVDMQQKAIDMVLSNEENYKFFMSEYYSNMGAYLTADERYAEAKKALEKGESLARTEHQRVLNLHHRASLYEAIKDKQKLEETIERIRQTNDSQTDRTLTLSQLKLADLNQDHTQMANLLEYAHGNQYIDEDLYLVQMAKALSHLPGKEREAINFYDRYVDFTDSLNLSDMEGRLEQFSTILKLQNNAIEKKQVEMNMETEKNKSLMICLGACVVLAIFLIVLLFRQMNRRTTALRNQEDFKAEADNNIEKEL